MLPSRQQPTPVRHVAGEPRRAPELARVGTRRRNKGRRSAVRDGAPRACMLDARPLTRNVSPTPGIKKSNPIRSSASRFVSVSAMWLPGRSGIGSVRSSRIRTNPAGSPCGETSSPPSGRAVRPAHTPGATCSLLRGLAPSARPPVLSWPRGSQLSGIAAERLATPRRSPSSPRTPARENARSQAEWRRMATPGNRFLVDRTQEVGGSNPPSSTQKRACSAGSQAPVARSGSPWANAPGTTLQNRPRRFSTACAGRRC